MEKEAVLEVRNVLKTEKLGTDGQGNFMEQSSGRRVTLRGINVVGSSKMPSSPRQTSYMAPESCGFYTEADHVSYVDRPFALSEAYEHLTRIKLCGYNTIRFVFTWEAIEHEGPGIYDADYVHYVVELLKIVDEVGGLYVILDPHQDVWSKFCGGSGAPLWTLYAAGLEPRNFQKTGASKLHNQSDDPEDFTRMVWATNYFKLAPLTLFTMFFSGKMFTPRAIIDGKNVQDYLQDHFIEAVAFLVGGIKKEAPELFGSCILGVESMNEPSSGLYGFGDLSEYSAKQALRLDESPTPIQTMRLGMGEPQEIETFHLTVFGSKQNGKTVMDPEGARAWVADDSMDKHYGFHRDPGWELGTCIWAQHGVWDPQTGAVQKPNYFTYDPDSGRELTEETFINTEFVSFWSKYRARLREVDDEVFLLMEPPALQIPPRLKGTDLIDDRTAVAIHYYDGMSLIFCKWNKHMNVNTYKVIREPGKNPILHTVFGERRIRNSFVSQFKAMKAECVQNVGLKVPVVMTETGMPYNMDNKRAYKDGDYSAQESANDVLGYGLDGATLNVTYWCYNGDNNHKWGDDWNLEDFSVYSPDDAVAGPGSANSSRPVTVNESVPVSGTSTSTNKYKYSEWMTIAAAGSRQSTVDSAETAALIPAAAKRASNLGGLAEQLKQGIRAPHAMIRPYPVLVNGIVSTATLDQKAGKYHLEIDTSTTGGTPTRPTVVFLPEIHFPAGKFDLSVSNGTTALKRSEVTQLVEWTHEVGIGPISMDVVNREIAKKNAKDLRGCLGCIRRFVRWIKMSL